jgi:hypothetical protein
MVITYVNNALIFDVCVECTALESPRVRRNVNNPHCKSALKITNFLETKVKLLKHSIWSERSFYVRTVSIVPIKLSDSETDNRILSILLRICTKHLHSTLWGIRDVIPSSDGNSRTPPEIHEGPPNLAESNENISNRFSSAQPRSRSRESIKGTISHELNLVWEGFLLTSPKYDAIGCLIWG